MKHKVRVLLSRKISSLLVLLLFTVHTDEVTNTIISLHYALEVYVIGVSLALP